ncbi:MAG TPA: pantoate--beta-alanine ligase [Propionibacteriaceae bacterium]|nr:pantoate--beta-alanine ligase [Propionibacteriaceae bacterium]
MIVARTLPELSRGRASVDPGQRVAFVPTMGALHVGHRSLVALARSLADVVVVSIFVNPLQFGPGEDYARYPRPIDADLDVCRDDGVDLVFVPSVSDLYPPDRSVTVSAGPVGAGFEGRARPGHFDGVLTVVAKLFTLVRPDVAIFGQKDAQQLACVRRMVLDLIAAVEIVSAPIIREPDGLAMSSRNAYLSPEERRIALALSAALRAGAQYSGAAGSEGAARAVLAEAESDPAFSLDYLALVQSETFRPVADDFAGEALLIVAATIGSTRLIDNTTVRLTGPKTSDSLVDAGTAAGTGDRSSWDRTTTPTAGD